MINCIDLSGEWGFIADEEKLGIKNSFFQSNPNDTINLPSTTSQSHKGKPNTKKEIGFLTDEYEYNGYAWFYKKIKLSDDISNKRVSLFLERTRITKLWVNGVYVGKYDSLCTPHTYDITDFINNGDIEIVIMVDNSDYPTKGGHLTSPDTQTNWNGITGEISIRIKDKIGIDAIKAYPMPEKKSVKLCFEMFGTKAVEITVWGSSSNSKAVDKQHFSLSQECCEAEVFLGDNAELWSEYNPVIYTLSVQLENSSDIETVCFGLRSFTANNHNFLINGTPTFLRGKHDGMIFPLTGAAPTTVEEWLRVMSISKSYGINHYRFHTCCPPEAAFTAADMLGIYMEPEILFWGTITDKNDEYHNETEQQYLIEEGHRILNTFGNHPSFTMFSLGNELWGSRERMSEILREYHKMDDRHLYTQGCNNFQFWPSILPEDDFFVGVRLSKKRLIRGSYATCDAPLGHIQTDEPSTVHNYDKIIIPNEIEDAEIGEEEIEIQYGTSVKKVKAEASGEFIPDKPVITHEIGQYAVYPNFNEISKYTGVLKARNFEVFRERLAAKGMLELADKFFMASGKLSADCYKEEIEAALRSKYIAGFQLLDIQDFSGQGTALVGILDAFMDNKGYISKKKWCEFCSDTVILAQFEKYIYKSNENFNALISLSNFNPQMLYGRKILWSLNEGEAVINTGSIDVPDGSFMLKKIGRIKFKMPICSISTQLTLTLKLSDSDIYNSYNIWLYPDSDYVICNGKITSGDTSLYITDSADEAKSLLENGNRVLYMPQCIKNSIKGFYCTDFWCYPMFREISQSMEKDVPVGTMGLLIDNTHPALNDFLCKDYSTPQWYSIVSSSDCTILDNTDSSFRPIVQMIDNFERNHKLGILYEAKIGEGKLLVCTSRLNEINTRPEVIAFAKSIIAYGLSNSFNPQYKSDFNSITGEI